MMDHGDHLGSIWMQKRLYSLIYIFISLILGVLGAILICLALDLGNSAFASQDDVPIIPLTHGDSDVLFPFSETGISVTKTVEPTNPDTGGVVSICLTVSGLGKRGLDLVLVQDVSPSMNDPAGGGLTRLQACQVAALAIVDTLPSTDRIAVVAYNMIAQLAQPLTTDRSAVTRTISGLTVTVGGTNIGEAVSLSHQVLTTPPAYQTDTLKTIILLSDGFANCDKDRVCGDDPGVLRRAADYARTQAALAAGDSIRIYTIGFGNQVDAGLLQDIAKSGHGKYFYAPDADVLRTIYLTIAQELNSLTFTDILTPGVETDCSQLPTGECVVGPGGVTTVTWSISNTGLMPDPLTFCFTATVNLDPGYEGPTNLPGSGICYQSSYGQTVCEEFENPLIRVGGRKIAGQVFHDLNGDGVQGSDEDGAPGIVVRTDTGLTTQTNVSGTYLLRTSSVPALALAIDLPKGYAATTPIPQVIPAQAGIYAADFGIRLITHFVAYLPVMIEEYPLPTIVNGSFEDGWKGWAHGGQLKQAVVSTNPFAGTFSALLGDPGYVCQNGVPVGSAWVEQTLDVPRKENRKLSFRYNIFSQDVNPGFSDEYDSFDVRIGNVLVFRDARTDSEYGCAPQRLKNLAWREGEIDLTAYRGQEILIRFEVRNSPDKWYNTWAFVDEVRLKR